MSGTGIRYTPEDMLDLGNLVNSQSNPMSGLRLPTTVNPALSGYMPQPQTMPLSMPNGGNMPGISINPGGGVMGQFGSLNQFGSTQPKSWWESAIGTKDAPGWGGLALGGAQALGGMFMGMKQYGIAKETLKENKKQFSMNFDAQRRTTNASLEDRQRRRNIENPNYSVPVDEYMAKNGIQ